MRDTCSHNPKLSENGHTLQHILLEEYYTNKSMHKGHWRSHKTGPDFPDGSGKAP